MVSRHGPGESTGRRWRAERQGAVSPSPLRCNGGGADRAVRAAVPAEAKPGRRRFCGQDATSAATEAANCCASVRVSRTCW